MPFSPGGTTDLAARILAEGITRETGNNVVVENRPGGFITVAVDYLSRQPSDGKTFLITANGITTQKHYLQHPRNPLNELSIVTTIVEAPMVLLASSNSGFSTLQDFVRSSRVNASNIDYATVGQGGVLQMAADLLQKTLNIRMNPIPYQGGSTATTDLLGNRIHLMFDSVSTGRNTIASGARALAVTSNYRSRLIPDVPTFRELGYNIDFRPWQAAFVSSNTNDNVKKELNNLIRTTLNNPETIRRFYDAGFDRVIGSSLDESKNALNEEIQKWDNLLRQ